MAKSMASVARVGFPSVLLCPLLLCPILAGCGSAELANDQAIGQSCDLTFASSLQNSAYNTGASECPSHICLQPTQNPLVELLAPATGPTCSGECSQDSDCAGELRDPGNPSDTRCKTGFTCAVPFEMGPLACRKLCVCKDIVGTEDVQTPISCQGVDPPPLSSDVARIGQTTDVYVTTPPRRKVDIVAMVDNSSTMAPKIEKFTRAFPTLVEATRDNDGFLADLRVAIVDSDLGTGGAQAAGACGPKLLADGTSSLFGDLGRFQMLSSPTACTFTRGSLFLEHKSGSALNYSGDLGSVASCLIGNLGTGGCGQSHPLQAFELALAAPGFGNEVQQAAFLRPEAYLALLFVTDKDDCSAAPNDGMFGDNPELRGESPSLRCATRAHACGGMNLATGGPGYPTVASYTHAFYDCQARTDACPSTLGMSSTTDTSVPTSCSPLRDITAMAKELLALKSTPDEQVVVAGFFGWPMSSADMASAQYKIAPVPNPDVADTAHPTVFDSWPVCYDPDHLPSPATTDPTTGFDATAAAWGATGGLRESAFIDALGSSRGMKLSVCEPDFSDSMKRIASNFAPKTQNLCVDAKPVDVDLVAPGLQADCRVVYRTGVVSGDNRITYVESPQSLPRCPPDASNGEVESDCWQLTIDKIRCSFNGQRIKILRTAAELAAGPLPEGTKVRVQCHTCPPVAPGTAVPPGCDY